MIVLPMKTRCQPVTLSRGQTTVEVYGAWRTLTTHTHTSHRLWAGGPKGVSEVYP